MAIKPKQSGPSRTITIQKLVSIGEVELGRGSMGMMEGIMREMGKDIDKDIQTDVGKALYHGAVYSFMYDGLKHDIHFETNMRELHDRDEAVADEF